MSSKVSVTLLPVLALPILAFPVLALIVHAVAGAPARAADADPSGPGRYFITGPQIDPPSADAPPTRTYIPLHPANPQEIGKEFAPIQATPFGGARSGQAQTQAAAPPRGPAAEPPLEGGGVPVERRAGTNLPGYNLSGIY